MYRGRSDWAVFRGDIDEAEILKSDRESQKDTDFVLPYEPLIPDLGKQDFWLKPRKPMQPAGQPTGAAVENINPNEDGRDEMQIDSMSKPKQNI